MTLQLGSRPQEIVSGSSGTSIPADGAEGFFVRDSKFVRAFIDFTGSVSECTVRKLTKNRTNGRWYGDLSTADLDPLVPTDGDTIRMFDVFPGDEISFQIVSVTGGSVSISADIVQE